MKDKTVIWIVTASLILVVFGIGYSITVTMVNDLENHPEITEIGAPPRLEYMAMVVVVALVMCSITLLVKPKEEKENENDKNQMS